MWTLAVLQAIVTQDWVGPTVAIALAILALSSLTVAVVICAVVFKLSTQTKELSRLAGGLQEDLGRTLKAVRRLTVQGQEVLVLVRQEAGAFAQTSQRIRRKVIRGADRIQEKLEDLEALYDVLHDEVADTTLDVATTLRSARGGNGVLGRVRRMLVPTR